MLAFRYFFIVDKKSDGHDISDICRYPTIFLCLTTIFYDKYPSLLDIFGYFRFRDFSLEVIFPAIISNTKMIGGKSIALEMHLFLFQIQKISKIKKAHFQLVLLLSKLISNKS